MTPQIGGVRPDAYGRHKRNGSMAFVEAKTEMDIDNRHTRRQLGQLAKTSVRPEGMPCELYIVIPRSAAYKLDKVLIDLSLINAKHIRRIHVPSVLIQR
jgi:hypothetical protein